MKVDPQEEFLTFGNCMIAFLYPADWQNFITLVGRFEDGITEIIFPQPSLSEKITPQVTISVEPCCEYITSEDAEGYTAEMRNMSAEEYAIQEMDRLSGRNASIINYGSLTLDGNPASKFVIGPDSSTPAGVSVYSVNHTTNRLYSIEYWADPSDYDTYLPGVQKIVDSFKIW